MATIYKCDRNLKETIALSLYPKPKNIFTSSISCCGSSDRCKNFLIFSNTFIFAVTKKKYVVKGELNCNTGSVTYFIFCKFTFSTICRISCRILKISLEYTKVTSAPRKIVLVQHDVSIINVVINMILTNTSANN